MEIISLNPNLSPLDFYVFVATILITFGFIYYGHLKKTKLNLNGEEGILDFLLMGRRLTLPLFIATLVATWYGGIFGTAQIAFEQGIYNFITQGLFWYVTYIIFAFFIVQRITPYKAMTLPDLVGKMFGEKSKKLAAIFNILNLVPIAYTISLGLIIQMFLNIPFFYACLIGILFVLAYSFIGGFRAVVYSDLFQFLIMTSSVIIVLIFSYTTHGIKPLVNLPPNYYSLTGSYSVFETFAWGLIALGTLVDPNFYQRCFAANSEKTAKKGIFYSTLIWIIFDLSLTIGAMYAAALLPNANSKIGYFQYAFDLLPNGIKGFFLAGILATVLSTLDSYLFLAGSTLSIDLASHKKFTKQKTHYLGIIITALASIILALSFDGSIKHVWKTLGSLSTAALLCPILYGHLRPKKLSDNGFFYSALIAAAGTFIWRVFGLKEKYALDEIYIGVLISFIAILIQKKRPPKGDLL